MEDKKNIHGTSNRDEARLGVCDPRPIPVKTDSIGLRKDPDALSVRILLHGLSHASPDRVSTDLSSCGTFKSQWEKVPLANVRECP